MTDAAPSPNRPSPPTYSSEIEAMLARGRAVGLGAPVQLDTPLDACKDGVLSAHLRKGWSHPEAWGCWSDSSPASFNIIVETPYRCDLVAEFWVQAYVTQRTPEQRVLVKVNDEVSANWTFTSGEPVEKSLGIPAKGLRFGTKSAGLTFTFLTASPESPFETGVSGDQRRLGIGLGRIRLSLAAEPVQSRLIEFGVPLDACEGGGLSRYLDKGWSRPEAWGCWSIGATASFRVPIEVPDRCDLMAEFLVRAYVSQRTPEQRVLVKVNGEEHALWTFTSGEPVVKKLEIPFRSAASGLEFTFLIASPESPIVTGTSSDRRRLGIGLGTMRLSLAGESPAVSKEVV